MERFLPIGPTNSGSMITLMLGMAAFFAAVVMTRLKRANAPAGRRDSASLAGIILQALSYLAASGRASFVPTQPSDMPQIVAVAVLMAGAVALFAWAAKAMGANWAIVAQTREAHELVTSGPFAWVRNPIYVAMALMLLAVATATSHLGALLFAAPLFAIGTAIRIRSEEKLLSREFGSAYADYAARVKRIVPGLF